MTNSLYTEALADAKAIREAAEARAKQQLVETMSPKIKLMVEKAILGEDLEEEAVEGENEPDRDDDGDSSTEDDSDKASDKTSDKTSEDSKKENARSAYESEDPFREEELDVAPAPLDRDMNPEGDELVNAEEVAELDELALENKRAINKLITKKQRKDSIVE